MRPRITRLSAIPVAAILVLAVASTAASHESWLQPVRFFAEKPVQQIVHMTSGMGEHYPKTETAIEASRVTKAGVLFGVTAMPLSMGRQRAKQLEMTWTPTKPGVAMAWVNLAARTLDLPDSLIDVYFDEIGASPELRKQWTDTPSPKKWRESYVKHAKTYVRVGDSRAVQPWAAEAGMELEIVPDKDPTLFFAGDTLPIHVVYKGQRLSNFTIASFREGGTKPAFFKTDANGNARLVYGKAGGALLAAVHLRRVHEPSLEWQSNFTSMTFPVRAKRQK